MKRLLLGLALLCGCGSVTTLIQRVAPGSKMCTYTPVDEQGRQIGEAETKECPADFKL